MAETPHPEGRADAALSVAASAGPATEAEAASLFERAREQLSAVFDGALRRILLQPLVGAVALTFAFGYLAWRGAWLESALGVFLTSIGGFALFWVGGGLAFAEGAISVVQTAIERSVALIHLSVSRQVAAVGEKLGRGGPSIALGDLSAALGKWAAPVEERLPRRGLLRPVGWLVRRYLQSLRADALEELTTRAKSSGQNEVSAWEVAAVMRGKLLETATEVFVERLELLRWLLAGVYLVLLLGCVVGAWVV